MKAYALFKRHGFYCDPELLALYADPGTAQTERDKLNGDEYPEPDESLEFGDQSLLDHHVRSLEVLGA